MFFDFVIKNVEIINGLNEKRFRGELGIAGDSIAAVAESGGLAGADAGR